MTTQPLTDQQLTERIAVAIGGHWSVTPNNDGTVICHCGDRVKVDRQRLAFREHTAAAVLAVVQPELDRLRAELEQTRQQRDEMTRCRDAALRALHRDDIATDIDVEETITNALHGPGWDWEDERTPGQIAREVAPAIRPALAKATQQLAAVSDLAGRWDNALAVDKPYARALRSALATQPTSPVRACGCSARFDRHAWGCPTLAAETTR